MLLAWVCLLAAAVVEAGPIHPPLQTLRNGHYTLVSAEVDHYDAEQRELTLKKVVKLRGPVNVAESIQVEVPANAAAAMAAGQRWLLVYSDVRRDSREARRNVRTDRRFIVHTDGAEFFRHYARDAYGGVVMAVVASQIVGGSERSEAMFAAMATRHVRHCLDLGSEALI